MFKCNLSAQLAVFTAASVETGAMAPIFVGLALTGHTKTYARHGIASTLGNRVATFFAVGSAFALRHIAAHPLQLILYGAVNLRPNRTISSPSDGHVVTCLFQLHSP